MLSDWRSPRRDEESAFRNANDRLPSARVKIDNSPATRVDVQGEQTCCNVCDRWV
ncbi:hypothetical protein IQ268_01770 [Oculatella sp. LEGE 06141]|uniref:hypothetical protein n=1 Tax=Oculatella sp. LEGE 06141 TaxID=1828648 RepID=UPI00187EB1F6|nr:hypothetical protein [Oculatella sp. LEGE 06141]MBE9177302.1 hypothetical protein [Oculatella sp. LEGE 06141]